ncbi:MAG: hypothetical protein LBD65_03315 [Spirochaetaceae bacterium]|jgi:hypothetical protein|nr:hypothetical protein [Spirochaetaceae bacterium]
MAVLDSRKKEPVVAKGLPNRATRIVKDLAGYQEKGGYRHQHLIKVMDRAIVIRALIFQDIDLPEIYQAPAGDRADRRFYVFFGFLLFFI